MDLGLFEISKGPSQQGLLDLGLFEISKGPSQQGPLDIGFFGMTKGPSQQGLGASNPMLAHCQNIAITCTVRNSTLEARNTTSRVGHSSLLTRRGTVARHGSYSRSTLTHVDPYSPLLVHPVGRRPGATSSTTRPYPNGSRLAFTNKAAPLLGPPPSGLQRCTVLRRWSYLPILAPTVWSEAEERVRNFFSLLVTFSRPCSFGQGFPYSPYLWVRERQEGFPYSPYLWVERGKRGFPTCPTPGDRFLRRQNDRQRPRSPRRPATRAKRSQRCRSSNR